MSNSQAPDSSSSVYLVRLGDVVATVAVFLAALPRYQFNPAFFQTTVTAQILLKALTNLPHTDFTLCKCMIDQAHVSFQDQGGCGYKAGDLPSVVPAASLGSALRGADGGWSALPDRSWSSEEADGSLTSDIWE